MIKILQFDAIRIVIRIRFNKLKELFVEKLLGFIILSKLLPGQIKFYYLANKSKKLKFFFKYLTILLNYLSQNRNL